MPGLYATQYMGQAKAAAAPKETESSKRNRSVLKGALAGGVVNSLWWDGHKVRLDPGIHNVATGSALGAGVGLLKHWADSKKYEPVEDKNEKKAQDGYGYTSSPDQDEQASKRRKKALAAAALLATGAYAGGQVGKYFGQQGVLKHLSDDANLAHFSTRGGERSFKAWPGYSLDVTKKIKYKG